MHQGALYGSVLILNLMNPLKLIKRCNLIVIVQEQSVRNIVHVPYIRDLCGVPCMNGAALCHRIHPDRIGKQGICLGKASADCLLVQEGRSQRLVQVFPYRSVFYIISQLIREILRAVVVGIILHRPVNIRLLNFQNLLPRLLTLRTALVFLINDKLNIFAGTVIAILETIGNPEKLRVIVGEHVHQIMHLIITDSGIVHERRFHISLVGLIDRLCDAQQIVVELLRITVKLFVVIIACGAKGIPFCIYLCDWRTKHGHTQGQRSCCCHESVYFHKNNLHSVRILVILIITCQK